jgi:osmotically-inducible protein OsmY
MSALAGVLFKRAGSAPAALFYKTGAPREPGYARQRAFFLHATQRHQPIEDGENVKTVNLLKALGIALCVATASSAYAQASDAMASGNMAAPAAGATSNKQADRALGRTVRRALAKTPGFNVSNVFVRARSGAVTLTGSVPEGGQIQQAADVAKGVPA